MLAPWVKKYIGIPFLSNGRYKTSCDCYGLLYLVYKNEFDTELPLLLSDYKNACDVKETKEIFKKNKPLIAGEKVDNPEIGDVVLLNYRGLPSHIGIYAGGGFMNRYHKSADLKTRKIKEGKIWSSTIKNLRNRHCYCQMR